MKDNIFTQEEIKEIKSMGEYWKEVAKRENGKAILQSELNNLFTMFRTKLLFSTLAYVELIDKELDNDQRT